MNLTTINESFGAAFSFSLSGKKRGLQAQIAIEAEVDPANLSAMKRKGKGLSEGARRTIFLKLKELVPEVPAGTYDEFLCLGQWILDGNDGKDWKPSSGSQKPETKSWPIREVTALPFTNKAAVEIAEWIEEESGLIDYGEVVKGIVAREFPAFMEFLKKRAEGGGLQTVQGHQDRKVANGET